ncbi:thiol reductant ABC exporter subunit CydC [Tessaracoccus terricola]
MRETTRPDRAVLTRWLVSTTRPVLAPLMASTTFRMLDQLAGLALFGAGAALVLGWAGEAFDLWGIAGMMVLLSLVKAVSRYLEQFLGHLVAFKALELLRRDLFSKLWPQAPAVSTRLRAGDVLERATKDVNRLEVFFAHTAAPAVTAVLTPLVAAIVIGVVVSPAVALVMGIGFVVSLCVPAFGARPAAAAAIRTAELRGRLTQDVTDSVLGATEVTGYGLQADRLGRARGLGEELLRLGRRVAAISGLRRGIAITVAMATVVGVVLVGLGQGSEAAAVAAAALVTLRGFEVTKAVEDFVTDLDASFASARRLWTLTHTPASVTEPPSAVAVPQGAIEVRWRELTHTYPVDGVGRGEPALQEVTAVAPAGLHTCLLGASGAGKSTMAQLVLRYSDPDEGAVLLGGVDVRGLALQELRSAVTHVAQRPFLLNASVADNLRLARPEASDEDIREACRAARISEHVESLPQGYDTHVGEDAGRWSGGQRARLALARALVTRARVFVLDEYSAHLDEELADDVALALREERPEATVIEVTHRVSRALAADHVVVLDRGRCVQAGAPNTLADSDGPFARLLMREGDQVLRLGRT